MRAHLWARLFFLEDENLLRPLHQVAEDASIPCRPYWCVVNVVVFVPFVSSRLSEYQLMIPDTVMLQPFNCGLLVVFCSSCEEADEMALVEPFVDFSDRVRIGTCSPHQFGTLVIYVLADTSVDVDYEDFTQARSRIERAGML